LPFLYVTCSSYSMMQLHLFWHEAKKNRLKISKAMGVIDGVFIFRKIVCWVEATVFRR